METTNMVEQLSTLTNINKKVLDKLVNISIECIGDAVFNNKVDGTDLTNIDIGIGIISILSDIASSTLKFKFTPSAKLTENLKNTFDNESMLKSGLQELLEESLVDRLVKTYKEIL